jgi:cellobiose phosphorylase
MKERLWDFIDDCGTFTFEAADKIKALYFPLANERIMSSITPELHGDIKTEQDAFLLSPVSRIDLINSRSSRNFWVYLNKDKIWSAAGVSKNIKQIENDKFHLEAGLLWQKVTRENKNMGLRAEIISFVPSSGEPLEVMQVSFTNITKKKIEFIPTAAIPIYARGANNIRDHRHVTSLLQRIIYNKFGVVTKPTLSFDEAGHKRNQTYYFVIGSDQASQPPQYLYPTQEMFCGEAGDLETPEAVLKNTLPDKKAFIQGRESMGALRFAKVSLAPGRTTSYIILMGITNQEQEINKSMHKFNTLAKVKSALEQTKKFWIDLSEGFSLNSANINTFASPSAGLSINLEVKRGVDFDNWFRWVSIQPTLRRIFGCSFLPDFDYGKGGRGWRDLWQDCLSLILNNPKEVRSFLVNNFSGVRIDGSNATIIGKRPGEFISDRNNISRVWMDHGIWPLLTLDLYLQETGDFSILFEKVNYFHDHQIKRSRAVDKDWQKRKTCTGTILEHLLVENLVQFFNVGRHNYVRLEGADWNDGLDMASERGESVAFSAMYAHNLKLLSDLILKLGVREVGIAQVLKILLAKNRDSDHLKIGTVPNKKILEAYFNKAMPDNFNKKTNIDAKALAQNLKEKADCLMRHIRKNAWLTEGFFNGYYDNLVQRVEGKKGKIIRMCLASQVFPILSGVADPAQVGRLLKSIDKYLKDKKLGGYHLNTDFKEEQHNLGRAFSFVYGDKENGAFFNHMIVMFAYALYKRSLVDKGWEVLSSIYKMACDPRSKIYPCLPEYFDAEGRGMYSYLTGSASWFVLTLITQVFGIKGRAGDLLIEPKLSLEQFKYSRTISVNRTFAERNFQINFSNPKKLSYGKYRITKATLNKKKLPLLESASILISRKVILNLPQKSMHKIDIALG